MDTLWNVEEKLHLSTPTSAALLVFSIALVIGVCIAIFRLARKGRNRVEAEFSADEADDRSLKSSSGYCSSCDRELLVKDVLSESFRWSKAQRWEESDRGGVFERLRWWRRGGNEVRRSAKWRLGSGRRAPVWQRPILMGEKCELPRFSGVILYDENGQPLHQDHRQGNENRF